MTSSSPGQDPVLMLVSAPLMFSLARAAAPGAKQTRSNIKGADTGHFRKHSPDTITLVTGAVSGLLQRKWRINYSEGNLNKDWLKYICPGP